MLNNVFEVNGNKISSFIADDASFKFSSQRFLSKEAFLSAWNKKLTLATKVEVKYDSIRSIRKEDNDQNIIITYKTWTGIPSNCEFSFPGQHDYETFFNFLEKDRFYVRIQETLTPFKAIRNYLIGFIASVAFFTFSYFQALKIQDGTVEEATNGKVRLFNFILEKLGDKGVVAAGVIVSGYLLYKIWARFTNPPGQTRFSPPNS